MECNILVVRCSVGLLSKTLIGDGWFVLVLPAFVRPEASTLYGEFPLVGSTFLAKGQPVGRSIYRVLH